jgi:hypothetical protein
MHPGTTPTTATGSNSRGESAAAEKEKFPRLERHPNPQVPRPTPPHAATTRGSDAAIFRPPQRDNTEYIQDRKRDSEKVRVREKD